MRLRLAAAFVAAAGAHLAIVGLWPAGGPVVAGEKQATAGLRLLPVRIVDAPRQQANPAREASRPVPRFSEATRDDAKQRSRREMRDARALSAPKRPADASPPARAERAEAPPPPSRPSSGGAPALRPVPEGARPLFLAHIRYPWQARRMGWQGRVTIGFMVRERRVRDVRLIRSSGYPVLDRAALDGIAGVREVALADGRYDLPVRFVLR